MKTVFLRVLVAEDKPSALRFAIRDLSRADARTRFEVDPTTFGIVPRSPFAYWVSEKLLRTFAMAEPLHSHGRIVASTNPLNDDFRYVRAWWETIARGDRLRWRPWAKGGSYSPFYYDIDTTVRWDQSRETYVGFLGTESRQRDRPVASPQYFFRPGLTWPRRTNGLSFRVMPAGCIFADKGPAAFVDGDDKTSLLALVAVVNSRPFGLLVSIQLARTALAQSYEVGLVQRTPVPVQSPTDRIALAELGARAWFAMRSADSHNEVSHAFLLTALLQSKEGTLVERGIAWNGRMHNVRGALVLIRDEIDELCFGLYKIDAIDRQSVSEDFCGAESDTDLAQNSDADDEPEASDNRGDDTATLTAELLSWTIGVAFARFDLRLATGERPLPPEPEPFDPLPTHSPGMLPEPYPDWQIGTLRTPPAQLVDDPGHPLDLTAAARAVFDQVFGAASHAYWTEAAAILDPKDRDLRAWFAKTFFEQHIKRYSKSRRKAPIYWQLATPSSRYAVWMYAHRTAKDSLFQIQNDLVAPKLAHEERKHLELLQAAGPSPTAGQRRELADQESFIEELRAMLDEVKRVAPLWRPDLDDGIVLTMAPLHRLVPQHKAWQKELKAAWEALLAGKYDWAHLAMHLWPERVVPKCKDDRSLAIAHGLEDVFWTEDSAGKWKARPQPTRPIDELVKERTFPAVKAALTSLEKAPSAGTGVAKRPGGRRKAGGTA